MLNPPPVHVRQQLEVLESQLESQLRDVREAKVPLFKRCSCLIVHHPFNLTILGPFCCGGPRPLIAAVRY